MRKYRLSDLKFIVYVFRLQLLDPGIYIQFSHVNNKLIS